MEDNERAVKSYQKVGFEIEGILKNDMFIQNEYKNIVIMGTLRK